MKLPSQEMQINTFSPFDTSFQRVLFYLKRLRTVHMADSSGHGSVIVLIFGGLEFPLPISFQRSFLRTVDRAFDSLTLVYNAPWPLNIWLHDRVLAKYNTIFCILARVKYALWALESVFHFLRNHRKSGLLSELKHCSLWL